MKPKIRFMISFCCQSQKEEVIRLLLTPPYLVLRFNTVIGLAAEQHVASAAIDTHEKKKNKNPKSLHQREVILCEMATINVEACCSSPTLEFFKVAVNKYHL